MLQSRLSRRLIATLVILTVVAVGWAGSAQAQGPAVDAPPGYTIGNDGFIENRGQWDPQGIYRLNKDSLSVWMTARGLTYQITDLRALSGAPAPRIGEDGEAILPDPESEVATHVVLAEYVGATPSSIENGLAMSGEYNWLVGDLDVKGAKAYSSLTYKNLYPGIDAHFNAVERAANLGAPDQAVLKATYEVRPGANARQITLEYTGANSVSVDAQGRLVIATTLGDIVEMKPVAHQYKGAGQEPVLAWFEVTGDRVKINVGNYDPAYPLFIDPIVIFSERFLGSSSTDYVAEMQEDATGRYFTGNTYSSTFPVTPGAADTVYNGVELFASKVSLDMQTHMWSTFLGGSSSDYNGTSALASDGTLYVTGHCSSCTFRAGTRYFGTNAGGYDAQVYHLSSDGSTFLASAVLRGSSTDYAADVEINSGGNVVVSGSSANSTFMSGWQINGWDLTWNGGYDAWVTILNPALSSVSNFTWLGGGSSDGTSGHAFDGAGNVYVYGHTFNGMTLNFPTSPGFTIGPGGGNDLFVTKFNSNLTSLIYSSIIGGVSTEPVPGWSYTSSLYYNGWNSGIFVDDSNQAWVTGTTLSNNYPTTPGAFQTSIGGSYDAFVTAVNSGGTGLLHSTYIGGGSGVEAGKAIQVDDDGQVWIAGAGLSGYPTLNAEQEANAGGHDFVRTIFLPDLSDIICSTFWGGNSTDVAVDLELTTTPLRARLAGLAASTTFPSEGPGTTFGPLGGYDVALVDLNCGGAALAVENLEITSIPRTHKLDCLTAGDIVQYTFDVINNGLSDQPDNQGPEFEGVFTGPQVGLSCVATSGTCTLQGTSAVAWNGEIPSGESVSFVIRALVKGGTPAGTELCIIGQVNFDPGTGMNEINEEFEICTETDCPPTVDPNRQLGMQVHLPIMNYIGNDDRCNTLLEIQNVASDPVKAVLVTWGEPGFCPPQAAGPLKVECTGLLKPGATWILAGDQIPTGSKSGMLFKFSTRQLSDDGLDEIFGFDDIYADLMCETLFFGVVGDSDDWRRFKKAYNEGGLFAGIPMDLAAGFAQGGILAVEVLRDCPGDQTAGVRVTSKYNGIAGTHLGAYDPVFGGYAYYVPLIYADKAEFDSWMYIQNGGLECSSVEVWLKAQDDCLRARICEVATLAPGETLQFDPNTCVGPQWQGSAWIRTSQPMGVAVDIVGRDVLMTYVGEPAELNFTFDPTQPYDSPGNQVAFGPLIYSEYQGWDSGIQVMNLSPITAAKVKVYFLDRSGDIITTLVDWICPRGSQTFFLPVVHDLPGNWVGSVRVESQEWVTPGGPLIAPPNIVAVATLIKYSDAQRTETREAIAYNLLPEHKIYDWQLGFGGGGLDSGVGLIAIPSLIKDLDGTGITTEVAIMNVVPKPGFTDFAIFIYDQNGLLDYICEKLNEKQVEYIDLQTWGYINNGFKGSAIISAFFWEHEVFDDTGFFLRNVVGLGAASVERSKTRLGEDVGGDEAAGSRGIPFRQSDVEDEEFEFGFMATPIECPGLPGRVEAGEDGEAAFICPPDQIAGTFGQGSPDWDDWDTWTAGTRIFRDGVPSACTPQKACPTSLGGGGFVDAYYLDNPDGKETCVTVNVTHTCGVQCMTYATSGRMENGTGWPGCPLPGAPDVDYLGDVGQSGTPGNMGFTIPSGVTEWSLVFANVTVQQTCDYTATITGFDCQ